MTTTTTACNSSYTVHGPSASREVLNSMLSGNLCKTGNNDELSPARIVASNIAFTSDQAYSQLMRGACEQVVSAELAGEIVGGANSSNSHVRENCRFLGELAINLDGLSKAGLPEIDGKPGIDSLVGAKEKLATLIDQYVKKPALNIVGLDIKKSGPFKAGQEINKIIDDFLTAHKGVFESISAQVYERYLEDGLVKALGERHGGCPDLYSANYSRTNGNASHAAKWHMDGKLQKLESENSSKSLAEYFRSKLSYLDLHMPAESARPPEASPVNHPKRGRAQDDAVNVHPAGGTIFRSGDLTAPIEIKIDGIGKVSSSGAEQVCTDTIALLSKELIKVYNELGKVKDDQIKAKDEQISDLRRQLSDNLDLRVGDTRRGSDDDQVNTQPSVIQLESSYEAEQSSDEAVDERAAAAQDGVIEIEGRSPPPFAPPLPTQEQLLARLNRTGFPLTGLNQNDEGGAAQSGREPPRLRRAVSSQAPTRLQTNAASGVGVADESEFITVRNIILGNRSPVLDSNESTSRRGSSDFGEDARRAINRTASVTSISPDSSAQTDLSDTSRTRAPSDTPVSPTPASSDNSQPLPPRYKVVMTNLPPPQLQVFTSVSEKKEYFRALSSVLQGDSKAELKLREHIQKGQDPSQDTGIIREYYDSVVEHFPAFVQIKRLFAQDETKNLMAGVVKAPVNRAIDRNAGQAASPIDSITVSQAPELVDESRNAAS